MRTHLTAAAAVAICLLSTATPADAQSPQGDVCIEAGTLLAEPGRPAAREQTIRVSGGRITAIEPGFNRPNCGRVIDQRARYVLPGLIDSHVHILAENNPNSRLDAVTKTDGDRLIDGILFARRTVEAGFTTVADLSAGGEALYALRRGIAEGVVTGPRLLVAGRAVAHGGHGDIHGYRPDVMDAVRNVTGLCSGADDCRRAVREAVRGGADLIKITATGGVLSNTAAGLGQQMTDEEMRAIVQTARALGRRVAAHAHGKDGIESALRAGVDSIEHGTYLDDETIKLFRQTGAYLVPTAMAGEFVARAADDPNSGFTPAQRTKARAVGPLMAEMLRRAKAGGVKIAFGTDSGVSPHGQNARELEIMVAAGFTPTEALRSATVTAAENLRIFDETGTIVPGKAADIIAVDGDPTQTISVMRSGVRFVMARGRIAKAE